MNRAPTARRVRPNPYLLDPVWKQIERLLKNPQDLEPRRHVAIPELRVEDLTLFGPPHVERLVGLEALVTEQGGRLVGRCQSRVRVQRRRIAGVPPLNERLELPIHRDQLFQVLVRCGDERLTWDTEFLLFGIVKGFEIPKHRCRRRNRQLSSLLPFSQKLALFVASDAVGARFTAPLSLGGLVRAFKARCARAIGQAWGRTGLARWQRNYHDRIVRDEAELDWIRRYIVENPFNWASDPENPAIGAGAGERRVPKDRSGHRDVMARSGEGRDESRPYTKPSPAR